MVALEEQGIYPDSINVLHHIYDHTASFICFHKDYEPSQLRRGVT